MRSMVAAVLADQGHRWQTGCPIPVESYLEEFPELATDRDAKLVLAAGEFLAQQECGLNPTVAGFLERFPDLRTELEPRLAGQEGRRERTDQVTRRSEPARPKFIDRYRVDGVLGQGAFGTVFLAWDDQLERPVAIKVPRRHRISGPEDLEAYLAEARIVASL